MSSTRSSTSTAVHVVAPLAAMAATWAARKFMDSGYKRITGHRAPAAHDPQTALSKALVWGALTAATAAIVEVAVYRFAASHVEE